MRIKRGGMITLGTMAVVLAGVLYYYLFFAGYLTERVEIRDANEAARRDLDITVARLGRLEQIRGEIEGISGADDLFVRDLIDTGDITSKIAAACAGMVSNLDISITIDSPQEPGGFNTVGVSLGFTSAQSDIPSILRNIEAIDICNRVIDGSISFSDYDGGECSVSMTVEFLYSAHKLPPLRENKDGETPEG